MAESAVVYLLKELSIFLLSESNNLGGDLEREVQFIRDELGSMRAFLRDADAKEDDVFELQEWIRQVKEVAYDIEDVLDGFVKRCAHHRADGFHGRVQKIYYSIKNLRARRRISAEMKNLKSRVIDISDRHKRYQPIHGNQGEGSGSALVANLDHGIRASSILIEEAELVGIDKPKSELISQILDDNSHMKVVAIVGMGGLGKTTLVRKVYDDTAVKKQFKIHAWLTISQTFHIMEIVKNLIQQMFDEISEPVPPQVIESKDIVRLGAFVKEFLRDRRYILVLDDVWSEDLWEALRNVLPDGNNDGRVVLTTRIADVASAACLGSHNYVHWMKPLSDEESWTLFCNRVFQRNHCPPHLEEVSARILKKCEGLPLAIAAIGGVLGLKDKDKIGEWEMIHQSLGGELEGNGKLDRIKRILLLSYNDLPHYLKTCFLYLSVYPEDFKIEVQDMIVKWIAHGFIQEKGGMSSWDIATLYAHELLNRSLLQMAGIYADGTLKYCRVHDFLHDMIVSKSSEQNFIAVSRGNYRGRRPNKVRRLAILDFVDNQQPQEPEDCCKHLRSLQFFRYISTLSTPMVSKFLRSGSKFLRVLDLSGAAVEDIPKEVFKLFHLKYLSLRCTQVRIIPKFVGKLQNLEFLDLSGTNVTEIPVEILKLRKLRFLSVCKFVENPKNMTLPGFKSPEGIGKLVSLEILQAIDADSEETLREIGKLTNLRMLNITKLRREDGNELLCSLVKLTNLQDLCVSSFKENETLDLQYPVSPVPQFLKWLALHGRLERVPQWVISLQGLTLLILQDSGLREDDDFGGMQSLQELPNLRELVLIRAYEGKTLLFRTGGFQKLKELSLDILDRLQWVRLEEGSLPSLQKLTMMDCALVEELPLGIQNLSMLKTLELLDMSDKLVQKVMNLDKQSAEYQAIAHIPDVRVRYWKKVHEGHTAAHIPDVGKWERVDTMLAFQKGESS